MARSPQSSLDRNNRNGADSSGVADSWDADTPTGAKAGGLGTRSPGGLASLTKKGKASELREENEKLRVGIDAIRQRLNSSAAPSQSSWEDREREFETILEEKSEEIRLLYMQIQQLERKPEEPPPTQAPSSGDDSELNSLAEELAQDQARLEEEREQLRVEREGVRQEEEDLERRMQEMELQTSKSRADLVRQRNELHRQYNEVRAELEQAKQSGAVSDRVRNLEREAQELSRASSRGK